MNEPRIELERYRHPLVRDLAWLLGTPDLIATRYPGRPSCAELGFDAPSTWLDRLDTAPAELEAFMADSLTRRLGHYHERLWQFLLAHAPATALLTCNLAVHDGRRTLGELDILYRHRPSRTLIHLEVAIKFYLGLTDGPGGQTAQSRWIGASGLDSLAIKQARLLDHQLPIAGHASLEAQLRHYRTHNHGTIQADFLQRLALPGVLFYPWRPDKPSLLPPPRGATARHLRGHWLHHNDWQYYLAAQDTLGAVGLHKPHWLAPPPRRQFVPPGAVTARLDEHFQQHRNAVQLMIITREGWLRRIMVVADSWPDCVPLAPLRPPRRRPSPVPIAF